MKKSVLKRNKLFVFLASKKEADNARKLYIKKNKKTVKISL
jgi:hypothetical protein